MLTELLYYFLPYQIFKSVFFRGGLTYLTTYFMINIIMPYVIRLFRRRGITSDFTTTDHTHGPYQGATPIMGGVVLIPSIILSILFWAWINTYTVALILIILVYSIIGGIDDFAKILHKRKVKRGLAQRKSYSDKADGIPGSVRLTLEIFFTLAIIGSLFWYNNSIDGHLHIPMIPMKTWFPELSAYLFIPFITLVIVGGANAVNLTDGLDSLVTIPIMTCAVFIAAAAYIAGDVDWSNKLKILFISHEIKEVSIFAIAVFSACIAFLKFNSPPASIYMGDMGSLGLGAGICTMFFFIKAELYLPIVGWAFVVAALSAILQRVWFKIALWKKGREWAQKNRMFYRAPYHHHKQMVFTYRESSPEIHSIWHQVITRFGFGKILDEDKFLTQEQVNNKVIWSNHLKSVFYLVVAIMIYFKVR
ncbi:MAG: phospho-N-acetylmuramoyl-pentapeptide-transferase [Deltaproteobacteria bacterium]|nr:phospho-N-acetylmuramoyl-pentapeptide-transferase [Deltaproteobacteria bacterium]